MVFVTVVSAVVHTITFPDRWNTDSIVADELITCTHCRDGIIVTNTK